MPVVHVRLKPVLLILLAPILARCEDASQPYDPTPGIEPSPAKSTVLLPDSVVTSGSTVTLMLQVRDGSGSALPAPGLEVVFSFEGGTSTATIDAATDNGDGTYTAKLTGVRAGTAGTVRARIGDAQCGSTPPLRVVAGPAAADHSMLTLSTNTLEVGQAATIALRTRDRNDNAVSTGGLAVTFTTTGSGRGSLGATRDNGDGTYSTTFTATGAGSVQLSAGIAGEALSAPPLTLTIGDHRVAASVTVTPPGITSAGEPVRFTAIVRDASGNELPGRRVTWSILTPAVASVNTETGDFVPQVTFGQTTVAATIDGVTGYGMLTAASPRGAQVNQWPAVHHNPSPADIFLAMWGFSRTEVYVVGNNLGGVLHGPVPQVLFRWNGASWDSLALAETNIIRTIWGSSPRDLYVAGEGGVVGHFDGTTWRRAITGDDIRDIWGSAPNDVWAATASGVKHFDGTAWTFSPGVVGPDVRDVWGLSSANVFAVSASGLYHFDGTQWRAVPGAAALACRRIWGTSSANLYCLDGAEVHHFDGSTWTALGVPVPDGREPGGLRDVWGSSASDIYVVGAFHEILGYDGTTWRIYSQQRGDNPDAVAAIWGIGTSLFTIGDFGLGQHGGTLVAPAEEKVAKRTGS